jgi:hypothetical protein
MSDKSDLLMQQATNTYSNLVPPTIEEQKLHLQELVQEGVITPEQAQTYLTENSQMENISLDPRLQQAQMDALAGLQDISQNKGLTDMDRAQLSQIGNEEATRSKGAREAILQNAQARGMGGSGLELMSQLQNQQDAATRQSVRDTGIAGQAQARALEALKSAGTLGGQIGQQQFSQKSDIAQAQDRINQFNTQNKQQVSNINTAANNAAQTANLAAKQNISNANVGTANQEQQYNKELQQKQFSNELAKANGQAGALQAQAQADAAAEAAKQASTKQLIGAGLGAAATLSDERLKENVEPFDASKFLDSLTGYNYNYKDQKNGKGKQVGVMAQDVEKEAPQMVEETPEGKAIDYNKAGGPLFASISNIHERLKELEGKK